MYNQGRAKTGNVAGFSNSRKGIEMGKSDIVRRSYAVWLPVLLAAFLVPAGPSLSLADDEGRYRTPPAPLGDIIDPHVRSGANCVPHVLFPKQGLMTHWPNLVTRTRANI